MRRCGSEKMNNYDRSTLLTEVSSGTGHELTQFPFPRSHFFNSIAPSGRVENGTVLKTTKTVLIVALMCGSWEARRKAKRKKRNRQTSPSENRTELLTTKKCELKKKHSHRKRGIWDRNGGRTSNNPKRRKTFNRVKILLPRWSLAWRASGD